MFQRFNARARQVVVLSQDEARSLKHNYIGTEHILLGLLREEDGLAAEVLASLQVTVAAVRARVVLVVGQGDDVTTGQIPFTPSAKRVLEFSLREALSLGHNYIGTEHVLLGLARENDGAGRRILDDFGADAASIRNEIIRLLSGATGRERHQARRPPREEDADLRQIVGILLEAVHEAASKTESLERAAHLREIEQGLTQVMSQFEALRSLADSGSAEPDPS